MTKDGVPKKALVLIALGATGVRLGYLAAFARDYAPRSDAHQYGEIAKAVARGDGLGLSFPFNYQHPTAFRPPLYPALLGAFYWITGVRVGAGQLLNVALGVAVVLLAALLGAHIAGRRGGVVAGVAVAVYPPILANDVVVLSETLSLALLLLMILLLVHDRPAWGGLVCGLLVLTRPSAQLLVVAVAAWLVWRTGWRAAVRFGAVSVVVVAPWIVRNWVLVGSPAVVTSNGFNLVATYSAEAQASGGFANASVDERFTRINQENRSEADIDDAYREHALDAIREQRTVPLRVVRHNLTNYFELRPGSNESAERDDGRNLTVRNVTLPLFYVVTAAGLVGLWRARRQRGAELLLLQAAYFTVASIAIIAVPRLRVTFDLAAAIGAGLLVAELIGRRAPKVTPPAHDEAAMVPPTTGPGARGGGWPRRTRVLAAVGVSITVIAAAAGIAVVRNRVHDNARSRLQRTIDQDAPAIQRLAAVDADGLIIGATAPGAQTDFKQAETVADRLWLLSPRLAGGLRSEGRDTARALDDAIFELKVLQLVTIASRSQSPATPSAEAIDAARATYETRVRRPNSRLPDWNTISANAAMRRAAGDLERLEHELRA